MRFWQLKKQGMMAINPNCQAASGTLSFEAQYTEQRFIAPCKVDETWLAKPSRFLIKAR